MSASSNTTSSAEPTSSASLLTDPELPKKESNLPPSPSSNSLTETASVSSGFESLVVTTVSPSGTSIASIVTVKKTSTASLSPIGEPTPTLTSRVNSSISLPTATSLTAITHSNGAGGLNGTEKVVVAVVVPIVGVALIAIALIMLWKRRQTSKEVEGSRKQEIDEYGYNPNNSPSGIGGTGGPRSSSNAEDVPYDMMDNDGYRGWGSTNGGRKVSNITSSVGTSQQRSPGTMTYTECHYSDGNASATIPIVDPHSAETSSFVAPMTGPVVTDNSGIHRGISNASSNYSDVTHSDNSEGIPSSHTNPHFYGPEGLGDSQNYSEHPYHLYPDEGAYMSPPVIRDVQARRNTHIETPTNSHFPQQGNSGIAQNF